MRSRVLSLLSEGCVGIQREREEELGFGINSIHTREVLFARMIGVVHGVLWQRQFYWLAKKASTSLMNVNVPLSICLVKASKSRKSGLSIRM